MKAFVYLSLLLCVPFAHSHAQSPAANVQLSAQKSAALPAHLTTRLQWARTPQLEYSDADLNQQDRAAIVRVVADETGQITQATIQESTGLSKLDNMLINATKAALIQPFQVDDTAVPTIGYQAFTLKIAHALKSNDCVYRFDSEHWRKQQQDKKVPFRYIEQPSLQVDRDELKGKDRYIRLSFKVDKAGNVTRVKIKKGSGIYALDEKVMQAVMGAKVEVSKTLWLYKKSTLSDKINFSLDACQ
ncbi:MULTISPECIES: energy transducer TonB [Acinetobacter]|uniref:energy transducer TonB n=1 Tax=Acinetobacter TaxID=469 RepID=UPI00065FD284|nr:MULTISPECIES: TonB family protein [Acinetobacter]KOR16058.1 TonB-dependent receptor [Acinetobacter sp. C15]MBO3673066.1 TonB family protein [Acinetobacter soli]RSB53018.1 TonB family protein [Acinetobacter soli]